MPEAAELPNDVQALKGIILERSTKLEVAEALLLSQKLELEKLRFEIAYLKRMKYGRSSEQLDRELVQMQLSIEDLEASLAAKPLEVRPAPKEPPEKPARRPLPAELPREEIVHENPCACPDCGGKLRPLGEDVSEMLEYVPSHFKVIKHVRPKLSCASCQRIVQPSAPSRPIDRGIAGPGLLAHVLVSKYCDHLPLYRQSQIYAREGIDLDRSTLADWVGGASALLEPLVGAIGRYALGAYKLHGDDTPVPFSSRYLLKKMLADRRSKLDVSPLYALTQPIGAVLFCYMLLRSTAVTLWQGGVIWRDTFYPLDELRRGIV